MATEAIDNANQGLEEDEPPRQLGHYEVQEKIGQGGMAVVYKGVQPSLNRTVAIKVLPKQFASTPELLGRFEREANIIAQLNHSNLVQVIDRGKENDVLYIVMEYAAGESLDKLIHKRKLSVQQIIDYSMQICDGLDYAHSMGVVHRDLKPSNVIVDQQTGRVKIADFGIAAIETTGGMLATLTYNNVAIGTMNYMSPEQRLDAHRVTHLTDIFSLGVVIYEMLTGKLPIGHFKLPSFIRPDIPIGFDNIVKKCLSESPEDRYQNAGAIRAELSHLSSHQTGIEKPSLAALQRLNKRQRIYAIAGASALGLLLIASISATIIRKNRDGGIKTIHETTISPEVKEATLQADFIEAKGYIGAKEYAQAIKLLTPMARDHATSPMAAQIQFTLAEAYYKSDEKETCKTEFQRVVENFPGTALASRAFIEKRRAEWDTAERKKKLIGGGFEYKAAFQKRLIDELSELVGKDDKAEHVPAALLLIATIARPDELADSKIEAEAWKMLYHREPSSGPDSIFNAAELFDKKVEDTDQAVRTYEIYLRDFPNDPRADKARKRVEDLKNQPPEE